jgi:hypothetical protein
LEFPALKRTEDDPPPCRCCCTLDVDETIIEVSEEALNLVISSRDDGSLNEREALCFGVEVTEDIVIEIALSETHEESSDSDSTDSETVTGWEIDGSKDKVQLFLPSG